MDEKCPLCGTSGKVWNKDPMVFKCPNCLSIFSNYGLVLESENEFVNLWA